MLYHVLPNRTDDPAVHADRRPLPGANEIRMRVHRTLAPKAR
jgi:hypothetical protein